MVHAALTLVLLGGPVDDLYLEKRLTELTRAYEDEANRQSAVAIRARRAILREIGHLPYSDTVRPRAVRLLAKVLADDRSYSMRVAAAHGLGALGTDEGLEALIRGLFGKSARVQQFALLHTILPDALARIQRPADFRWIGKRILEPSARREKTALINAAGPLRRELVALTIEGVARAGGRMLEPELMLLIKSPFPRVRRAALRALGRLGVGGEFWKEAVRDPEIATRRIAARARALPLSELELLLDDPETAVRRAAIRALQLRGVDGISLLIRRLREEKELRHEINESLVRTTGRDFGDDYILWSNWWRANIGKFVRVPEDQAPRGDRAYFFDVRIKTRKVIFLVDVSGSMSAKDGRKETRLKRAADELQKAVSRLSAFTEVRVFAFASEVRAYPHVATRLHAERIHKWLTKLVPSGPTNTYGALMTAFDDPFDADTIILLSDGNPTNGSYRGKTFGRHEQILAEVARRNRERDVRVHAVAFALGLESEGAAGAGGGEFLARLARLNAGTYREIQ